MPLTGQRLDPDTGLYDYRARFYDPFTGSFIQPDSIVPDPLDPRAWNRFGYVYGNPTNYVDPSGHVAIAPWDALDIGSFLWSASDFYNNPTWGNAGWLVLDTIGLLPLVPSIGAIRHAGNFSDAGKVKDIYQVLRSTRAGEEIYQKAAELGLPAIEFRKMKQVGEYKPISNKIYLNESFRNLPSELAAPTLAHELDHRTRRWFTGSLLDEFSAHSVQTEVWSELRRRRSSSYLFFRGAKRFRENEKIFKHASEANLMSGYLLKHTTYRNYRLYSGYLPNDPKTVSAYIEAFGVNILRER